MKLDPQWFNYVFPVTSIEIYQQGWRVKRSSLLKPQQIPRGIREEIKQLSKSSLHRLAFTIANTSVKFRSIITLTYGREFPTDGKEVKANLNHFLVQFQRSFGSVSYCWFIEFQRRGAPHFHILLSHEGPTITQRAKFANIWVNCCADCSESDREKIFTVHNHRSAWEKIRLEDGAKRYALKYCLKPYQKTVPEEYRDVGRFWGTSRDVKPELVKEVPMDETTFREALDFAGLPVSAWDILPKYIFDYT